MSEKPYLRTLRRRIALDRADTVRGVRQALRSAERLRVIGVTLRHNGYRHGFDSWKAQPHARDH